ncbi:MAG: aldo/keto reductase [Erysipelotrichaceae bacterium]|nr:aldo/keto reductase [Erysipelotrichaceae bacterium]
MQNNFFEEIHGRFGFGCMRLPLDDNKDVVIDVTKDMFDLFLEKGFNYFDTAHGYLSGKSETALRECLTSRYPRDKYLLTNKLSSNFFEKEEDIRPLFQQQLEACGVDYFDFYLMHAQSASNYPHYKECRAYETAFELKKEGKIRHVGISFHDSPQMLETILNDYPELEAVQLQFNYLDYESPTTQSRACYDVCVKYNKPVIVMEPVKGGALVNLPEEAEKILTSRNNGSVASYAVRFVASHPQVMMILSGMNTVEMVEDNTSVMADFKPLTDDEYKAIDEVVEVYRKLNSIPCTGCRYCTDGCPMGIKIPDIFSAYNAHKMFRDWHAAQYYQEATKESSPADCIQCGQCEGICPQQLPIIELLQKVKTEFDNLSSRN